MTLSAWSLYALVAAAAVISPGPATLLAVNNAVAGGPRSALPSTLSNVVGIALLSGIAMVGLGALLQASAPLFTALKVAGALYLVYLGVRQWRRPVPMPASGNVDGGTTPGRRDAFVQGLFVALSNPKSILFFTALFPQFLDHGRPLAGQFAIMTATFMTISFASLTGYAALAGRVRRWLRSARGERLFRRACGSLFVVLGLGLLSSAGRASAR